MKRGILLFTALALFTSFRAYAEHINVSGDVSGTWAVDTVFVTADIQVPDDQSLIVEPGTKIIFEGHFKFDILPNATLKASGTELDTVLFSASDPPTGWRGIRFVAASDSSKLEYCHITYGKAEGSGVENYGGGIYLSESSPTIVHCLINHCSASGHGGGIYCDALSNANILNCTIEQNIVGSWSHGGGICSSGNPTIRGNLIINNDSHLGGGIYSGYEHPYIENNIIEDNFSREGGGIYCYYGEPRIINNLITNNIADSTGGWGRGGGIYCKHSDARIINNTIAQNTAVGEYAGGGGIFNGVWSGTYAPIVLNCILSENDPEEIFGGTGIHVNYCSVGDSLWSGIGNIQADPLFIGGGDFHLSDGSPCIGSGIEALEIAGFWYYAPNEDLEGNLRPNPVGSDPDMGAYESALGTPLGISSYNQKHIPNHFTLYSAFPNPFNPTTVLSFQLSVSSRINLTVYDISGRLVTTLVNGWRDAGVHEVTFDGSDLVSGVYLYRLTAGEFTDTGKMVLMK
ncbi:hypothetical protein CEE37_04880 [candidate division LCP-89 bacterium B3_LCP]|uniref:Secretion system C-terminal sorting domain-containing protein n=1 Tax=candidate division LCP-89 bacterium B3_LCP TaxID=2012998 RepID=A0A532V1J9_UNCL8|nr:MAG: hypothetical protein CEE37_04880 [candidate division LCP-89 bacterium B3_LCP]